MSGVLLAVLLAHAWSEPARVYGALAGAGGFAIVVLMFLTGISVVLFFGRNKDTGASLWHRLIAPSVSAVSMAVVLYLATSNFTTMTGGSLRYAVSLQELRQRYRRLTC